MPVLFVWQLPSGRMEPCGENPQPRLDADRWRVLTTRVPNLAPPTQPAAA